MTIKIVSMLLISLAVGLLGTVLRKYFIDGNQMGIGGGFVFNAISTLMAGVVLLLWGGIEAVSTYTILLGIGFGILTALQGITNLLAIKSGPLSYTTVIISCSTVISALSGAIFFHETLTLFHIVGILLMLLCFVFATDKEKSNKKTTLKWLLYCFVAFVSTGLIGVMQKVHQNSPQKDQLNLFLVVAFGVSALLCSIFAVFLLKNRPNSPKQKTSPKHIYMILCIMVLCGIFSAINNKFNLYLSGVMDSAVFFPIVNGGGLILTTVFAIVLFKERCTKKQWCGLLFGILSVVFLCNPF